MRILRKTLKVVGVLAVVYALLTGGLFWTMCQPVDRFTRIMARVPGAAFLVFPFEPLWNIARAGELKVGDMAPDFNLMTTDKSRQVQLASFRGQKPVVLVFGSYT